MLQHLRHDSCRFTRSLSHRLPMLASVRVCHGAERTVVPRHVGCASPDRTAGCTVHEQGRSERNARRQQSAWSTRVSYNTTYACISYGRKVLPTYRMAAYGSADCARYRDMNAHGAPPLRRSYSSSSARLRGRYSGMSARTADAHKARWHRYLHVRRYPWPDSAISSIQLHVYVRGFGQKRTSVSLTA